MTNFERLISDKDRLAELLGGNGDFMEREVEPGWCHKECPYKDHIEEHKDINFKCPVSDAELVKWWLEKEVTDCDA